MYLKFFLGTFSLVLFTFLLLYFFLSFFLSFYPYFKKPQVSELASCVYTVHCVSDTIQRWPLAVFFGFLKIESTYFFKTYSL